jgi:maleylacetate reductase
VKVRGFVHESPGCRVLFGAGRVAEVPREAKRLGKRLLIVAGRAESSTAQQLKRELGPACVELIIGAVPHVPEQTAERARAVARDTRADCVVAVGGGSAIGVAKAIALTERIPILAVPTTYAGSEMTPVWGITRDGVKTTGHDLVVAPRTVVYDPVLTYSLPPRITAASGMNAVAHGVEAFWAPARSPFSDAIAERALAILVESLPQCVSTPGDPDARAMALIGAWLAGAALAVTGTSIHHKICHVLCGAYDLPHAETHATVLPWAAAIALSHEPDAAPALARALGGDDPIEELRRFTRALGTPDNLAALGLTKRQAIAVSDQLAAPDSGSLDPLSPAEVHSIVLAAWGDRSWDDRHFDVGGFANPFPGL